MSSLIYHITSLITFITTIYLYPGANTLEPSYPGTNTLEPSYPGTNTLEPSYPGTNTFEPSYPGTNTFDPSYPGIAPPVVMPSLESLFIKNCPIKSCAMVINGGHRDLISHLSIYHIPAGMATKPPSEKIVLEQPTGDVKDNSSNADIPLNAEVKIFANTLSGVAALLPSEPLSLARLSADASVCISTSQSPLPPAQSPH